MHAEATRSVEATALRAWLVLVAVARIFSVYLALTDAGTLLESVYPRLHVDDAAVVAMLGRLFATWTATTCVVVLVSAADVRRQPRQLYESPEECHPRVVRSHRSLWAVNLHYCADPCVTAQPITAFIGLTLVT